MVSFSIQPLLQIPAKTAFFEKKNYQRELQVDFLNVFFLKYLL